MLKKYKRIDTHEYQGNYFFCDTSDVNLVLSLLNDQQLKKHFNFDDAESIRNDVFRHLLKHNADFFEHITGRSLSIFESRNRLKQYAYSNPRNFFISLRNIPKNHTHDSQIPQGLLKVQTYNKEGNKRFFLVDVNTYKKLAAITEVPIDCSAFKECEKAA